MGGCARLVTACSRPRLRLGQEDHRPPGRRATGLRRRDCWGSTSTRSASGHLHQRAGLVHLSDVAHAHELGRTWRDFADL